MSLEIEGTYEGLPVICDSSDSSAQNPLTCNVDEGDFVVRIVSNVLPLSKIAGFRGFTFFQTFLSYGRLLYQPIEQPGLEVPWLHASYVDRDDGLGNKFPSTDGTSGRVLHSSFMSPHLEVNGKISYHVGTLVELTMSCQVSEADGEVHTDTLALLPYFQQLSLANGGGGFKDIPNSPLFGGSEGSTYNSAIGTNAFVPLDIDADGELDREQFPKPTATPALTPPLVTPTPSFNSGAVLAYPVHAIMNVACLKEPAVLKSPSLSNLFLTAQGAKAPPATCLSGTDGSTLTHAMVRKPSGLDKAGDPRELGGFSFEVNYDETKVCIELRPGPLALAWQAAGGGCIIQDSLTKPTLQGSATIACNSLGKAPLSPPGGDNLTLAEIVVRPMPDEYSLMKPGNGNGNVVQIINKACKLTDRQGDPIAPLPGAASCTDADITIRYLEGDVAPDCVVDTIDTQAEAFRWGSQKGTLLYSDFFNTEPAKPQQDDDIDINDLQFVYGRFGSTCAAPHPPQPPENPKAA
ncbi:MAG: hypothetical protein IIC89_02050 [Chloroflexi bacterium]|nr:hypothetical protein [Chloroflexota bacterium]